MFVFRNYTIENLFPEETKFSGYDDISYIPQDERTLVWLYQVPIGFDIQSKISSVEAIKDKLQLIFSHLTSNQTLIICSLIDLFPVKINDSNYDLNYSIGDFNRFALQLAANNSNVKFIDIQEYFSQYPSNEWITWRFYFISQMIVAPIVAANFPAWFNKKINQIKGIRKKCLVLDLDNTLWGGILGEDGIEGIKIGGDYPGNAFLYFQEALISLSKTGVILSVCSKNNEQDVFNAWEKNPFIKLKASYISCYRINWENKAKNIVEIAKELNIGLDSMVFVDDNPTERELIRQQLPLVAVPEFPKRPYELMEFYRELVDKYFKVYTLTAEDLQKTDQYKANAQRSSASKQYDNLEDFIRSLEININLIPADKFNIPRIAQMTQKTNQFNLTTKRYTETDIESFVEDGDYVYCISVNDKFGDNGITGMIIIKRNQDEAEIDSFLLSCRILGKGIEDAFFKSIVNHLYDDGIKILHAVYIPTAKNSQVSCFYDKQGMLMIHEENGKKQYSMNLTNKQIIPEYYNIK